MKSLLIIFAISLLVRIANLLVINLNIDTYIVTNHIHMYIYIYIYIPI